MIITEYLGDDSVRRYSNLGVYIYGGYPEGYYEEAIDPISMNRTYIETDREIESELFDPQDILNLIFGGDEE